MLSPGFKKHSLDEIILVLKQGINDLARDSYNLIIAGEGCETVWKEADPSIRKAVDDKNCKFEILFGPIASADENGVSSIVQLCKENYVTPFVSYRRQERHGRLFGLGNGNNYEINENTYLVLETHHEPLDNVERYAQIYKPDNSYSKYQIKDFLRRFKYLTSLEHYPKSSKPEEDYLILPESRIKNIVQKHKTMTNLPPFDLLRKEDIERLAEH